MKVICVDSTAYPEGIDSEPDGIIEDGKVYEVIDVYMEDDYIFYTISIDPDFGYWENCFARCSDMDEALKEVEEFESGKKVPMSFTKFLKTLF